MREKINLSLQNIKESKVLNPLADQVLYFTQQVEKLLVLIDILDKKIKNHEMMSNSPQYQQFLQIHGALFDTPIVANNERLREDFLHLFDEYMEIYYKEKLQKSVYQEREFGIEITRYLTEYELLKEKYTKGKHDIFFDIYEILETQKAKDIFISYLESYRDSKIRG